MKMITAVVFMTSWWDEVENSMSGPRRLMQDPASMRIHPTTDTTSDIHLWKKSVSSKHYNYLILSSSDIRAYWLFDHCNWANNFETIFFLFCILTLKQLVALLKILGDTTNDNFSALMWQPNKVSTSCKLLLFPKWAGEWCSRRLGGVGGGEGGLLWKVGDWQDMEGCRQLLDRATC